jgi:hypothetical protein
MVIKALGKRLRKCWVYAIRQAFTVSQFERVILWQWYIAFGLGSWFVMKIE